MIALISVLTALSVFCAVISFMPRKLLVTKTGKVLTRADIDALADEAEAGYDVSDLKPRT